MKACPFHYSAELGKNKLGKRKKQRRIKEEKYKENRETYYFSTFGIRGMYKGLKVRGCLTTSRGCRFLSPYNTFPITSARRKAGVLEGENVSKIIYKKQGKLQR